MELKAQRLPETGPTEAELEALAGEYLADHNWKNITAKEAVAKLRSMFVLIWQKRVSKEAVKAAEFVALEVQLRHDTTALSESGPAVNNVVELHPAQSVPTKMDEAEQRHRELLPPQVFADPDNASAFRGELCWSLQRARQQSARTTISAYQRELSEHCGRLEALIEAVNEVIVAWGNDPRRYRAPGAVFGKLIEELKQMPDFEWVCRLPKWPVKPAGALKPTLSLNDMARAEAAAAVKAFNAKRVKQIEALLVENAAVSTEEAEKMVARLLRKYPELGDDSKALFTRATVNRQVEVKGEEINPTARLYMLAAGLTEDELHSLVENERKQRATEAEVARQRTEERRCNVGYGAQKEAVVRRPGGKKDKGNEYRARKEARWQ